MQGEEDSIEKLLKDLNEGPSAAHVTKVEKTEREAVDGESNFATK